MIKPSELFSLKMPLRIALHNEKNGWVCRAVAGTHQEAAEFIEMWSLLALSEHILTDLPYQLHGPLGAVRIEELRFRLEKTSWWLTNDNHWFQAAHKSFIQEWLE